MLKYAKIENPTTKVVSIGTGTNTAFYVSIGMTQMEVEQSDIDGQWYAAGFAPKKSEAYKQKEKVELREGGLMAYLAETDWYAIRFAETGVAVPEEIRVRRQMARKEIDALRLELAELEEGTS